MIVYPIEKPGKKKKKKRGLLPAQRDKVYREVIDRDVVCQNPFCKSGWPLDIPHHVDKKSAGGLDIPKNLTLTCVQCHRLIHDEWINVTGAAPDCLVWIDKRD